MANKQVYLIFDNIRSKQNVGSIFRTSDCVGVNKIYLSGTTPTPLDKYGRPVPEIQKIALGAEKTVEWQYVKTTNSILKKLKKEGFQIIAIEQSKESVDYKKINIKSFAKIAFVLGNEVEGVNKNTLKLCDIVAEIPMKGEKESLNVSIACAVVLFRLLRV